MRPKMNRALAGYLLAGIAMLVLMLYLRFPGEAVRDYLKAAAAGYPQFLLSIDGVRPSIPPGLVLENVTAAGRQCPEATLHADRLSVRPGWLFLPTGRLTLLAAAEGYGGKISGRVDFSRAFSARGPFTAKADIREIRIEKCAWLRQVLARQVTGTLRGTLSVNGVAESMKDAAGDLDFTLTNGTYPLLENFFGVERLDFSRVEGKAGFRKGVLKITQLTLTGETLRCSLKGNILFADNIEESRIDLEGFLEIPVQGNRKVTLNIGGTLGNPKTRFF